MRPSGFVFAPDGFAGGSSARGGRPKAERFDRVRGRLADAVLAHLPLAVAVVDGELNLLFWNAQAAAMWGMPPLLAADHPPLLQAVATMGALSGRQKDRVVAFCAEMVALGDRVESDNWLRITISRDSRLAIQVRGLGHGRWMLMLNDGRGLGEARKSHARAGDVASMDALTGLVNRRHLERTLLELAAGDGAHAVLLLDILGMRAINAAAGRAAGDALLTLVARRLEHALRQDDLLTRYSGDAFAILVPNGAMAAALADRLLSDLSRPFLVEGRTIPVQFAIGIAHAAATGLGVETLFRRAALALQTAKAAGPNQWASLDAEAPATSVLPVPPSSKGAAEP